MAKPPFIVLTLIAISGLCGCVPPLPSSLWCDGCKWPGPTINQVAKTWVGYTEGETTFFRLELFPNGTGRCANIFHSGTARYGNKVETYWITSWKLEGCCVLFDLVPTSTGSWPIYLKGTTSSSSMDLEVGYPKGSWSRKLVLRPEINFFISNRDTKQALSRMAQPPARPNSPPTGRSSKPTP